MGYGDERTGTKGTARMNVTTNLFSIIGDYASKLFDEIVDESKPIRRLGYSFENLMPQEMESYDFFTDLEKIEKEKKLVASVIKLQDEFGKNSILKGLHS